MPYNTKVNLAYDTNRCAGIDFYVVILSLYKAIKRGATLYCIRVSQCQFS